MPAKANLVVEPSFKTNDALDVGQDSKRSQNRSKMGVVKPKGIFSQLLYNVLPTAII